MTVLGTGIKEFFTEGAKPKGVVDVSCSFREAANEKSSILSAFAERLDVLLILIHPPIVLIGDGPRRFCEGGGLWLRVAALEGLSQGQEVWGVGCIAARLK